jgi:hypothetical protein
VAGDEDDFGAFHRGPEDGNGAIVTIPWGAARVLRLGAGSGQTETWVAFVWARVGRAFAPPYAYCILRNVRGDLLNLHRTLDAWMKLQVDGFEGYERKLRANGQPEALDTMIRRAINERRHDAIEELQIVFGVGLRRSWPTQLRPRLSDACAAPHLRFENR